MIGADLRTKRFLPRANNGNILPRCRPKQIVYLSTWKYCRAFPGQIASFRPLVKTVSISFRPSLARDTQPLVIREAYGQFHSSYRVFQNAQIIFRERIVRLKLRSRFFHPRETIDFWIKLYRGKQICIMRSLCNQPFAINLALIANVRHNPGIISSKKLSKLIIT